MKKVKYPNPMHANYVQNYLNIYNLGDMQVEWDTLRQKYHDLNTFPTQISEILKADFGLLTNWYIVYMALPKASKDTMSNELEHLFNYDAYGSTIADYFKNPVNGFNISTCHYCDTAYVNTFIVNTEADAMLFLNTASDDELMSKLNTKSIRSLAEVKRRRPYKTRNDFDRVAAYLKWKADKYDKVFKPNNKYRHHFDLDHVLPKSKCPIVGLSLYNFVPSCQICNQKLKKTKVLGVYGIPNVKLSPTSASFDIENGVECSIVPRPGTKIGLRPALRPNDFEVMISPVDPDYEIFVKIFKLNERYSYHKKIALHWLEMKVKYTPARLAMMAKALNHRSFSQKRIQSDIFQEDLYKEGTMCFAKLKRDILK